MVDLRNFNIKAVGNDLQFGKSGGRIKYNLVEGVGQFDFLDDTGFTYLDILINPNPIADNAATSKTYVNTLINSNRYRIIDADEDTYISTETTYGGNQNTIKWALEGNEIFEASIATGINLEPDIAGEQITVRISGSYGDGIAAGDLYLTGGGTGNTSGFAAGNVEIIGGSGDQGGNVNITGGQAGATSAGKVEIVAGGATSAGVNGAFVSLTGGNSALANGGNVLIFNGVSLTGSGTNGNIILNSRIGNSSSTPGNILFTLENNISSVGYVGIQKDASGTVLPSFRFITDNGYVGFRASQSVSANILWTLPAADGSVNQALVTNGAGVLSWAAPIAARFTASFTTGTWSGPSGGYYTITYAASTHGKGTTPIVQIEETSGTDNDIVLVDRIRINSSGDVEIRAAQTPDNRFNGRITIL